MAMDEKRQVEIFSAWLILEVGAPFHPYELGGGTSLAEVESLVQSGYVEPVPGVNKFRWTDSGRHRAETLWQAHHATWVR